MRVKDAVGRFGEQVATEHLLATGHTILSRNWRCRDGELDIVTLEGTTLVVVEVKTRSSLIYGTPAEAVDHRKATRIRRAAAQWMEQQRSSPDRPTWRAVRFDVVSVVRHAGNGVDIEHLAGAF